MDENTLVLESPVTATATKPWVRSLKLIGKRDFPASPQALFASVVPFDAVANLTIDQPRWVRVADIAKKTELPGMVTLIREGLLNAAGLPSGLRMVSLTVRAANPSAPVILEAEFTTDDGEPPRRFVSDDLLALVAARGDLTSIYLTMLGWLHANAK